jgi:hypothetical protein
VNLDAEEPGIRERLLVGVAFYETEKRETPDGLVRHISCHGVRTFIHLRSPFSSERRSVHFPLLEMRALPEGGLVASLSPPLGQAAHGRPEARMMLSGFRNIHSPVELLISTRSLRPTGALEVKTTELAQLVPLTVWELASPKEIAAGGEERIIRCHVRVAAHAIGLKPAAYRPLPAQYDRGLPRLWRDEDGRFRTVRA